MTCKIKANEPVVHWRSVIYDLSKAGLRRSDVAARVGMSESGLGRLFRSETTSPTYNAGERLIKLWSEVTGRPIEEVPRMNSCDWRF